jgi:topoisomerase-4 subunit A
MKKRGKEPARPRGRPADRPAAATRAFCWPGKGDCGNLARFPAMSKTPSKDSDAQLDLGLGGPGALAPARPAAAEPPKPAAPAAPAHPALPAPKITGPLKSLVDVNFLQYASYVIKDRAIPDLADGLKPVQRRILWSLHEKDDGKFIKVANISGYCMQYHPHGDASINDALVTLANKQYLIEGQGNFGNLLTGDSAAAPRYIECRLTELARKELFNDALTEFVPSYDGRSKEPVTLPCKIPLLLMLGADGIAVGLATRILPHNFPELLEAQIAILQKKPFRCCPTSRRAA